MLAATLRGDAANRTLEDLEKRLLNAFARDIARDRYVVGLRRDLVYFVDVDYAALCELNVAVGVLEKVADEILDVFANIARLSEHRRVADGERNAEHLRKRPRKKRLACSRWSNKENVRFLDLYIGKILVLALLRGLEAAVVVVDGNGKHLLHFVVADDILVEKRLYRLRGRRGRKRRNVFRALLMARHHLVGVANAIDADVRVGAGNHPDFL